MKSSPRKYYAAQSPRGFANEVIVYVFNSRQARDEWVDIHKDDGDVNAATRGAYAITAKDAKRIEPNPDYYETP